MRWRVFTLQWEDLVALLWKMICNLGHHCLIGSEMWVTSHCHLIAISLPRVTSHLPHRQWAGVSSHCRISLPHLIAIHISRVTSHLQSHCHRIATSDVSHGLIGNKMWVTSHSHLIASLPHLIAISLPSHCQESHLIATSPLSKDTPLPRVPVTWLLHIFIGVTWLIHKYHSESRPTVSDTLIERTPPPRGNFLFTMLPRQEPWE